MAASRGPMPSTLVTPAGESPSRGGRIRLGGQMQDDRGRPVGGRAVPAPSEKVECGLRIGQDAEGGRAALVGGLVAAERGQGGGDGVDRPIEGDRRFGVQPGEEH